MQLHTGCISFQHQYTTQDYKVCAFSTIALHVHAEAICFAHQSRSVDPTKGYLQREMLKGFYPPHFQLLKIGIACNFHQVR